MGLKHQGRDAFKRDRVVTDQVPKIRTWRDQHELDADFLHVNLRLGYSLCVVRCRRHVHRLARMPYFRREWTPFDS